LKRHKHGQETVQTNDRSFSRRIPFLFLLLNSDTLKEIDRRFRACTLFGFRKHSYMKIFPLLFLLPFISLVSQTDDSRKIYSDSTLVRIDITISSSSLQWIFNNVQSDSEHIASIRFRNGIIDESVDSIGFRLRGNTSRDAKKKSFKVSFNSFIKGRKFHGVEKLNLNGEHNDPSIIRSKLAFDFYQDMGILASRANHARVYINGSYYGLYVNVEHVDEEFLKKKVEDDSGNLWKCLYPADLKYLGSDPNLYKNVMHNASERAYELTTNETTDDYSQFARLVGIISNTPADRFTDSLEAIMDVRSVLQYFAVNTLVGGWDDYRSLMNNFYLYHTPSTGKFTLIPYDYDNTFGIDWFNVDWASADPYAYPKAVAGARPLWERMMANGYRDLYTHYLKFYRDNVFALPHWDARLQRVKDTISAAAVEDLYRTLDYGFTITDFHNSYSSGPFNKLHAKRGVREFVNRRYTTLANQLNFVNSPPIVYDIQLQPAHPKPSDSITVNAACFGAAGLKNVWLVYTPAGAAGSTTIVMSPAAVNGTKNAEEYDRWSCVIPPLNGVRSGAFRIFIQDSLNHAQMFPRHDSVRFFASQSGSPSVIVNEFMADNKSIADPAGQYDDWIELYNPTSAPVMLTNKYLTDKSTSLTKWKFTQPNLVIGPGEYRIVWCDEEPLQEGIHAMIKLSAGGEFIALTDSDGVTVLDSLSFGPQTSNFSFGRYPNGSSGWGFMNPTPLAANSAVLSAAGNERLPLRFGLEVFPNPFNPTTQIRYWLPEVSSVEISIVDMLGRSIWHQHSDGVQPGEHSTQWNGVTNDGLRVGTGVYFLRVAAASGTLIKKLLLLK
jgi:spore coat protein H